GSADLRRVRADLEEALGQLDRLDRIQSGCQDESLCQLLGDIQQRKSRQASRLMRWLGGSAVAAPSPAPAGNEAGAVIPTQQPAPATPAQPTAASTLARPAS